MGMSRLSQHDKRHQRHLNMEAISLVVDVVYVRLIFSGIFGAALGLCHIFLLSTELSTSMGIINSLNKVGLLNSTLSSSTKCYY